jgi:hypothetical protein
MDDAVWIPRFGIHLQNLFRGGSHRVRTRDVIIDGTYESFLNEQQLKLAPKTAPNVPDQRWSSADTKKTSSIIAGLPLHIENILPPSDGRVGGSKRIYDDVAPPVEKQTAAT